MPKAVTASSSSPVRAHHIQTGNEDAPCAGAELTLNSSLVAAATPRLPGPAWPAADPLATMSLRYPPGVARPGTTSSRETRAALPGAICPAAPGNGSRTAEQPGQSPG